MRGRRREKTGGVFAEIRRGFFRAENEADAGSSIALAEWHGSDRVLRSEAWEEGSQLKREAHVTADAKVTGHGDHGTADLAVQHTQAIFT